MRFWTFSLLGMIALLESACSHAPDKARHTVEQYRADAELRHAQVARCRRDPGTMKTPPDCINAEAAAAFEDRRRLRGAPSVGLEGGSDSADPADGRH